ncbi:MAG: hypothetical protein GJU72_10830 [Acidithiobacillus ferriphilus]|jgi:DNA-binding SARP family transcriptional activator|uniref:hypothetical protein n=1 Tax=Acidithiobacillus ferriphilus TaxID=1689834 RepID=UPI001C60B14F|nr:hypothetical protein [Acidithiobacillus ferriphilus]MBW9249542.1 hypothetical protein [Acidithiobacillus ferriphilus]MBW9254698.1 hypothetical protein [Acidithiobacillus ferriphilus]
MSNIWDDEWLNRRYYEGLLPEAAERHLHLAARSYADDVRAEDHLMDAIAIAPEHMVVYLGLYKFYFYKGRLSEALATARICLQRSAAELGIDPDWRKVRERQADFGSFDAPRARFYMFVLKAYGYLHLRLGHLATGSKIMDKLIELDPTDKIQARVLLEVLQKKEADDEDE